MTRASSFPSMPPLEPGASFAGRFRIRGVLGEGASGTVYDAVRIGEEERPLALKVVHPHLSGDRQIRGRFVREAAILARLEGAHLLPLVESGETEDPRLEGATLLFMALPKVEGPALDAVLKQGPMDVDRATDVMSEVCEGLEAAHHQGVIHRDLKPANVLLDRGERAVVVDFGLAKIITGGGGTGTTQLTTHNMIFGTPEYMAPEQARGDDLDARCDVYAAGVMLYELLTGTVPFAGKAALGILTAHMTDPPEPPRARAPTRDIPVALEAVVLHAMAKDPRERYGSAAELRAALRHARARPGDVEGVKPASFRDSGEAVPPDAMAPTIPGRFVSMSPPKAFAKEAPSASSRPARAPSTVPPETPSSRVLDPEGAGDDGDTRSWTFVWIVAVGVAIAVGVWLSLRTR